MAMDRSGFMILRGLVIAACAFFAFYGPLVVAAILLVCFILLVIATPAKGEKRDPYAMGPASAPAAPSTEQNPPQSEQERFADVAAALQKLDQMRRAKLVSEDEYQSIRRRTLSRL